MLLLRQKKNWDTHFIEKNKKRKEIITLTAHSLTLGHGPLAQSLQIRCPYPRGLHYRRPAAHHHHHHPSQQQQQVVCLLTCHGY